LAISAHVRVVEQDLRLGVGGEELELGLGQPEVQGDEDRTQTHARELQREHPGRVQREYRDAVAVGDAEVVAEHPGDRGDPALEAAPRQRFAGGEVLEARRIRPAQGVMRDDIGDVVIGHRTNLTTFGRSG